MRPATSGNGNDAMGQPIKPDDGYATFNTAEPPGTASYWTPSAKNNGDLWCPFFAIQIKNASTYGKDSQGQNCLECYPNLFHQNKHYFFDM